MAHKALCEQHTPSPAPPTCLISSQTTVFIIHFLSCRICFPCRSSCFLFVTQVSVHMSSFNSGLADHPADSGHSLKLPFYFSSIKTFVSLSFPHNVLSVAIRWQGPGPLFVAGSLAQGLAHCGFSTTFHFRNDLSSCNADGARLGLGAAPFRDGEERMVWVGKPKGHYTLTWHFNPKKNFTI